jgi:hypothetical protein
VDLDDGVEESRPRAVKDRPLAPAAKVREFLCDLANSGDDWTAIGRFVTRYGKVLPGPIWRHEEVQDAHSGFWRPVAADRRLLVFRDVVRRAWVEADRRKRNRILIPAIAPFLDQPHQPHRVIEQAFWYLIDHPRIGRFCPNPGCPAPYFIPAKRGQRYCALMCTADAQRSHKKKWWAEHGQEWRRERLKRSAKKKRAGMKRRVPARAALRTEDAKRG